MGGPREPGDVPRPRGDVPRGEGGRRDPGEGGRCPLPVGDGARRAPGEGGRAAPLMAAAAAATTAAAEATVVVVVVVVGEGGLREAGLRVREPGGVLGDRSGAGTGLGAAPGDTPLFGRAFTPTDSDNFGEGFRRGAPLEGDRCRRTLGEVGGVARLAGGEGVTRVPGPRPPTPPPRGTYLRGLTERCNNNNNNNVSTGQYEHNSYSVYYN